MKPFLVYGSEGRMTCGKLLDATSMGKVKWPNMKGRKVNG